MNQERINEIIASLQQKIKELSTNTLWNKDEINEAKELIEALEFKDQKDAD